MSKHTPKPWRANGCEIIGNSRVVATVHWCSGMQEEDRANIALVESAPALLEALEDMLSGWRYIRNHYGDLAGVGWERAENAAVAAIAAAKGDA